MVIVAALKSLTENSNIEVTSELGSTDHLFKMSSKLGLHFKHCEYYIVEPLNPGTLLQKVLTFLS